MKGDRPTRLVAYGLGHKSKKSQLFERRSKRSFRRWLRQVTKRHNELEDQ